MNKTKLAIFDIDGTIFRSSLLIELVNALVAGGIFPRKAKGELEKNYLAWLNRKGDYEHYVDQVITIYLKYLKGCKKADVEGVSRELVKEQKDRVYRFTRDLLKKLKRQHYYLVAISGSPDFVVSSFAPHMGFNAWFGSRMEMEKTRKNVFTGKVGARESWKQKNITIKKFVGDSGLTIDWKKSIAIGDTDGDISLLELVGNPIAFNPNKTLASYAKKKRWRIVVERKDVIYELETFQIKKN